MLRACGRVQACVPVRVWFMCVCVRVCASFRGYLFKVGSRGNEQKGHDLLVLRQFSLERRQYMYTTALPSAVNHGLPGGGGVLRDQVNLAP